jgi:hypothetical protein
MGKTVPHPRYVLLCPVGGKSCESPDVCSPTGCAYYKDLDPKTGSAADHIQTAKLLLWRAIAALQLASDAESQHPKHVIGAPPLANPPAHAQFSWSEPGRYPDSEEYPFKPAPRR